MTEVTFQPQESQTEMTKENKMNINDLTIGQAKQIVETFVDAD